MKPIEITITEKDLAEARPYPDNCRCIMATALTNRGHNVLSVGSSIARIADWNAEGEWYFDPALIRNHLHVHEVGDGIDYKPSIVGTTVVLYHNPLEDRDPRNWRLTNAEIFNIAKADAEKETNTESETAAVAQEVR